MKPDELEVGIRVSYWPDHKPNPEHGIIKSHSMDVNYAFVVYNCAGNWDEYQNYTGARTLITDLKKGWL